MAATTQNPKWSFCKQTVYNSKDSFEEQNTDLLSDWQTFILGNISCKSLTKRQIMFYLVSLLDLDILDRQI